VVERAQHIGDAIAELWAARGQSPSAAAHQLPQVVEARDAHHPADARRDEAVRVLGDAAEPATSLELACAVRAGLADGGDREARRERADGRAGVQPGVTPLRARGWRDRVAPMSSPQLCEVRE